MRQVEPETRRKIECNFSISLTLMMKKKLCKRHVDCRDFQFNTATPGGLNRLNNVARREQQTIFPMFRIL